MLVIRANPKKRPKDNMAKFKFYNYDTKLGKAMEFLVTKWGTCN